LTQLNQTAWTNKKSVQKLPSQQMQITKNNLKTGNYDFFVLLQAGGLRAYYGSVIDLPKLMNDSRKRPINSK
jgi:hypothetical protein